ncbi:13439_t:CDS:2 [Funneliformis mosseae]|uniref:13439_t:CDS:1 n=1 Tax=Funneliformis mosseae TaxID=27381 RepID=A0A9N9E1Z3_FUNMO|nr:13439_t:CDS:2 [Funneliformis mosseae]
MPLVFQEEQSKNSTRKRGLNNTSQEERFPTNSSNNKFVLNKFFIRHALLLQQYDPQLYLRLKQQNLNLNQLEIDQKITLPGLKVEEPI